MAVSVYVTLSLGAVFMPLNPLTKANKLAYLLNDSRAAALMNEITLQGVWAHALAMDRSVATALVVGGNTAAALLEKHIRHLRALFPQAILYSMYGLTECKRVTYLPSDQLDIRPTSVGCGMPNEKVWLVDDAGNRLPHGCIGELVIRSCTVMRGY
jgi:acyl-CoA synthetase (AMP-forming)/AMP-acid ligase II